MRLGPNNTFIRQVQYGRPENPRQYNCSKVGWFVVCGRLTMPDLLMLRLAAGLMFVLHVCCAALSVPLLPHGVWVPYSSIRCCCCFVSLAISRPRVAFCCNAQLVLKPLTGPNAGLVNVSCTLQRGIGTNYAFTVDSCQVRPRFPFPPMSEPL